MSVMTVKNVTYVRDNFRQFFEDVVRKSPQAIKKHNDVVISMSQEHLAALLDSVTFTLEYAEEDDGSCSGALKEVDIVGNAVNLAELKKVLAEHLLEYAEDYMADFHRYVTAPNHKAHLPYIMQVLVQPNLEALVDRFH